MISVSYQQRLEFEHLNSQHSCACNSFIKVWFCAKCCCDAKPKKKGPGFCSSTTVQFNQLKDSSCPENNKQAVCGRPTLSASNELFKILPPSYLKSHIARFFHSTAFHVPHHPRPVSGILLNTTTNWSESVYSLGESILMTVKLCTSQKVSGEPAVWQGMDGSTLEKWVWGGLGWGGGRGMRDSRESITAGGDAG